MDDGATVYASAAGGRLFGHLGHADEDEVHLGDACIPLVFVRTDDQDPDEIAWQARKVGYDELRGEPVGLTDRADQGQPVCPHSAAQPG